MVDFTAYRHPVLAVVCPDCAASHGGWCKRPSGHKANDLHAARKRLADTTFISQHGESASIARSETGWEITPHGQDRAPAPASASPDCSSDMAP